MKLIWNRTENDLAAGEAHFVVTNIVRNELNGRRKLHDPRQVVNAVVNGQWGPPYMPRQFPIGTWKITAVEDTNDPEFAPIKIRTNASQPVTVWALDKDGGYDHPTDKTVMDSGYHLHYASSSSTTLGCGRVGTNSPDQVRKLAGILRNAIARGESLELEVIS